MKTARSKLFIAPPREKPLLSRSPGIQIWLPHSETVLTCFPTFWSLTTDPLIGEPKVIESMSLPFQGPIDRWVVKRYVTTPIVEVEGRANDGTFFRFYIEDLPGQARFVPVKGFQSAGTATAFFQEQSKFIIDLGGYKDGVWEKRWAPFERLGDMKELVQGLLHLIPPRRPTTKLMAESSLLSELIMLVTEKTDRQAIERAGFLLEAMFRASFSGIYTLSSSDRLHLGYTRLMLPTGYSTNELLGALTWALIQMMVRVHGDILELSSLLRTLFPSGRVWNVSLEGVYLSYEWRKGVPRRIVLRTVEERDLTINTHAAVSSCSARATSLSSRKKILVSTEHLHLKANIEYLYDNFIFL